MFDIAELREVTAYDELELDTLGDRKTALFLIMSDTDDSFNFLISMCYTQLFNLLCEKADDVYGGRLPVHVRCLIDEAANIGQIPRLEKLVATIRSREISACLPGLGFLINHILGVADPALLVPQLVPHDVTGGFQLPQRTADGINALLADFRKSTGSIVPVIRQG